MHTNVEYALPRSQPEREGIPSTAILQLVEVLETQMYELHSYMLLRHPHVVAEGWWSPYRPEYPHLMFSVSKSLTSTAVGIAVAEGGLSIDEPVLSFFPDDRHPEVNDFLINMSVNVNLDLPKTVLLTARLSSGVVKESKRRPDSSRGIGGTQS